MATFTKINDFVEDLAHGVHNLATDTLKIAISNTAPSAETNNPSQDGNGVIANVTQATYSFAQDRVVSIGTSGQTGGTYTLTLNDKALKATANCGPFRYIYLFNDDTPSDSLIGYWDYGSSFTLSNGETFTAEFSATSITLS